MFYTYAGQPIIFNAIRQRDRIRSCGERKDRRGDVFTDPEHRINGKGPYMIKCLKRITVALLLLTIGICMLSGCTYKVKNEDKALNVYTCSSDNVFGLEKIVVFEDRVVTVLDKNKFSLIPEDYYRGPISSAHLDNLRSYKSIIEDESSIKTVSGKIVVTTVFGYDEKNIMDPDKDVVVTGISIQDSEITFNDGNLHLSYSEMGGECEMVHWQDYDLSTGTWKRVEETMYYYPLETGIYE